MAQRLGEEGTTILVRSNEQDKIDEAVKKLVELGIEASGFFGDVSRRKDNKNLVETVIHSLFYSFNIDFDLNFVNSKSALRTLNKFLET